MTYAVIRTGGKQYRVSQGDSIQVEKLPGQPGDKVEFAEVLLLGGEPPKVGKPTLSGAKVLGEIEDQARGPKLVVFKFKRRKKYHRKAGHRQALTQVKITEVKG
jgi:large subunit ribosomal protein L21